MSEKVRIIKTHADVAAGCAALAEACRHMRRIQALTGPPPLRRRRNGFMGLARIVVGQQLSVASATAIWGRLETVAAPLEPEDFLAAPETALRGAGLSAGKIRTLRGVAEAVTGGSLDLKALARAGEGEVRAQLTALRGIGPWTADIYEMFCLGRADAWAPGDLALQNMVQQVLALEARPDQAEMVDVAERWRPWRSVAARLLWAYYKVLRDANSGTPV